MLVMQDQDLIAAPPLPPTEPNDVAQALFAAGRLDLHVDGTDGGLCVTVALDGEYVTGVAHSWPEVAMLVNTAVRRLVCGYMHDVIEADMTPRHLSADAARYFSIQPQREAAQALLLDWAKDVRGVA